jgi:hypothetical protein
MTSTVASTHVARQITSSDLVNWPLQSNTGPGGPFAIRLSMPKKEHPVARLGLSYDELQAEIANRMARLDEAQEEEEHLGPYGDLMRLVAMTAFQRAADLISLNNRRIERQLADAGIVLGPINDEDAGRFE